MTDVVGLKSLAKIAQLLDTFTFERQEWALSELAAACNLHPSTARRLLLSCQSVGFIGQDPITRRYRLGMKLFELGSRVGEQFSLRTVARPYLKRVNAATQESVYLGLLDRGEVLYIDRVESPHPVRLTTHPGQRRPLHSTGSGKLLLAYLSDDALENFLSGPLERFTDRTICDPDLLRQELARIRERGYSTTLDEHLEGTFSLAAPIYGQGGVVVAALGVSGPRYRISDQQWEQFADVLTHEARQLSLEIGAGPKDVPQTVQEVGQS